MGTALRGLGEKLVTTSATGSATFAIPLPVTPGRAGFELELQLDYDSGFGNGPFGLGWRLASPSISRKTDQRLPTYLDFPEDGDEFVLSGAEDLVPARLANGDLDRSVRGPYRVDRYRCRVETAFTRIERWTDAGGRAHWRTMTRDNILNIYGATASARVSDPAGDERVFSWLLEETRDDRGNIVRYSYRTEDDANVDSTRASEASRFAIAPDGSRSFRATAQRYLKRIQYGNRAPILDRHAAAPAGDDQWLFEVVLDYGEHDPNLPAPRDDQRRTPAGELVSRWPSRRDPFSTYRPTFEVRTYRLCRRVLMFHRFPELGADPVIARSLELTYDENPFATYLTGATEIGWVRSAAGGYTRASWPTLELDYQRPILGDELRAIDSDDLPAGVETSGAQWLDLDGDGIPGVLIPSTGGWFYKANEGDGRLGPAAPELAIPMPAELRGAQTFTDLEGDGNLDLISHQPPLRGYFERTPDRAWRPFAALDDVLNLDWNDPQLRLIDLDGDGLADVMITRSDSQIVHRSRGKQGFEPALVQPRPIDERLGPAVLFSGDRETIQLADMSGDGLVDLVRVRNGDVCYWPNLGFGRFGPKVTLDRSPWFDTPDLFDPQRVRFADVDGSGAADLLYLGRDGVWIYRSEAGNALSPGTRLTSVPAIDDAAAISIVDLLGRGTSCLVRSTSLGQRPLTYVDLAGGVTPHKLIGVANNLGAETRIEYAPSTAFFLADRRAGRPWTTRLPFPVQVVARVETYDRISQNRFVSRYAYHEGYFDGLEREFRGFGLVEQWDSEELSALGADISTNFAPESWVHPVHVKTWFHTGATRASDQLELPAGLTIEEEREAHRALKGSQLRREIYADDGSPQAELPYTITEQTFAVVLLQRRGAGRHAVFLTHPREVITRHSERTLGDPRIAHELTLEVDGFGNVLRSAAVAYGRRNPDPALLLAEDVARQAATLVTYVEHRVTAAIDDPDDYRPPLPAETRTYELRDYPATGREGRYRLADLANVAPADPARLLVEHTRKIYRRDDLDGPLPLGRCGSRAILFDTYQLAFPTGLAAATYQTNAGPLIADPGPLLREGGHRSSNELTAAAIFPSSDAADAWWIPSGRLFFSPDPAHTAAQELAFAQQHFFVPLRHQNPHGAERIVAYDAHDLLLIGATDAVGNQITARADYRVLEPIEIHDHNACRTAIAYDARGMLAGTALMGRAGEQDGDTLAGFVPDLDEAVLLAHLADPLADPAAILGRATTRVIYDPLAFARSRAQPEPAPPVICSLTRTTHDAALNPGDPVRVQQHFSYSDGFGREIQKKLPAERDAAGAPRWIGSGWTIFNNKGLAVRKYEPFFAATHRFELARTVGVSPIVFYDPLARAVATIHPDGSYEKAIIEPWRREAWDRNDTCLLDPQTDPHVSALVAGYFAAAAPADRQTWRARKLAGNLREQEAAAKTALHAATPATSYVDALGRTFATVGHLGFDPAVGPILAVTRVELDIEGQPLSIRDPIGPDGRETARFAYDLAGRRIRQANIDAGEKWILPDVDGEAVVSWNSRGFRLRTERDPLRRLIRTFAAGVDPANPNQERMIERIVYGEQHPDPLRKLRGAIYLHLDQAGALCDERHDFKGNSVRDSRRLAREYAQVIDWSPIEATIPNDPAAPLDLAVLEAALAPRLEAETFTSSTRYDALNRATQIIPAHVDQAGARRNVVQPRFNEGGLLEAIDVWLDRVNDDPLDPGALAPSAIGVRRIDYDARGRRVEIEYKNGAITRHEYDLQTSLLTALRTDRFQHLLYTYDPNGNLTHVEDAAQPSVYFANQRVDASTDYTYDALYRLSRATGREHVDQAHPNDGDALRSYTEELSYDLAGNLTRLRHVGAGPAAPAWVREFRHLEPSRLEANQRGNRLTRSETGALIENFAYDAHGNTTSMPHLQSIVWGVRDELKRAQRAQQTERTYYVYDAGGTRVRKVTVSAAGAILEERISFGTFERYRRFGANPLERETLHVMDGDQRLASTELRTQGNEPGVPQRVIRYQLADHLSSVTVELDEAGAVLSYEECSPYGVVTLRLGVAAAPSKRFGFRGKERDDETGFVYFGARYYAPWLARWTSCDPVFDPAHASPYVYASANPVTHVDVDGLYDPAAFGKQLEAYVSKGENALLLEDRNIGTSLVNTHISTTATVARGFLSILQVGTGAAQGVEDIQHGFSDEGDGWDIAIGVARVFSDAGEVASASLGVVGNGTKVARVAQAAKVEKQINTLRKRAQALEKRIDDIGDGRAAKKSPNVNEKLRGQVKEELDQVKEQIGELAADKAAVRAGLTDVGNPRRLATGGQNPGQPVRQGLDKVYTGKKPFAKERAVVVEAKANLDRTATATKGVPLSTSGPPGNTLTQGSTNYIRNRLAAAANNPVAANLQTALNTNRLRLESFAVVGDTAVGGTSKVFRLTGASGTPNVSQVFGYGSEVTTMNLTLALDIVAQGGF